MKPGRRRLLVALVICIFCFYSCQQKGQGEKANTSIVDVVLEDTSSFYFINFKKFPEERTTLPIGIFDSGTGGLAVMETILRYDSLQNQTWETGSDGMPDFNNEQFVYLADQANMPYGNYYSEGKSNLLIEHIIKDAQFLLSDKYYGDPLAIKPLKRKQPVKVIVVACNTATVYGKKQIEDFIEQAGAGVKVIGVIDAGARGALSAIKKNEDATIGVFATVGTIASQGYPTALKSFQKLLGYEGNIDIVGQGGYGLAESIDGEPGFIDAKANDTSSNYKGPAVNHAVFPIDTALLHAYRFEATGNSLLCNRSGAGDCSYLQLNSPVNYARYHLVSLLEQIKKRQGAPPLKAIILGCTHYPYLKNELRSILSELYNLKHLGKYVYRNVMADNVKLIDPAENVATELAAHLKQQHLFDSQAGASHEFFISVPNLSNPNVEIIDSTHFTYSYKYGRNAGSREEYVKMVPFSKKNIPEEVLNRLSLAVPTVYEKIRMHMSSNSLTSR